MSKLSIEDPAMEGDLNALKSSRTALKKSVSTMRSKIEQDTSLDSTILECRLQILESYFKQICHIQSQIERLNENDNARPDIEDSYISVKSMILNKLKGCRSESVLDTTILQRNYGDPPSLHRLPDLQLPKFNGKYSEYKRFISSFNNLVNNEPIATIDKFNYLLNCLSDQALAAVEAFQVTEENYPKALTRLAERFDNKVLILKDHITSLFEIPSVSKADAHAVRKLLDTASALRGSLLSLGTVEQIFDAMFIQLVLSKLDVESRNKHNEAQDFKNIPSWTQCYSVLSRRCQILENTTRSTDGQSKPHHSTSTSKSNVRKQSYVTKGIACQVCNCMDHFIYNCPNFLALPSTKRYELVKREALCLNCLRKGHTVSKCSSKSRCRMCNMPHHSSLHFEKQEKKIVEPDPSDDIPSTSSGITKSLVTRTSKGSLIPTAVVLVMDQNGLFHPMRAILDSCSELNFITEESAKRLKLNWERRIQEVSGISDVRTKISKFTSLTLKSRFSSFEWTSSFAITEVISASQPGEHIEVKNWNLPSKIELADPQFFKPQHVDLLIGVEVFFELLKPGYITLGPRGPSLVNSVFGWIVGGSFSYHEKTRPLSCNLATTSSEADLNKLVEKFWKIDEFQRSSTKSTEDELAERHFVEHTKVCEDGRLMLRLPFKSSPLELGSSFDIAQKRFYSLERKLNQDTNLKKQYMEFINEYIDLGHMSEVERVDKSKPHYYIPHHCVLKPESVSTKLRVVYDASAKTSTGKSLNDILLVGPTIQQDLVSTLLAFRLNKFALVGDVSKMFRQFLVDQSDRVFQLILWRDNLNDELRTYALNTITYGLASSPFQAIRCLTYIADLYGTEFPVAARVLKGNFYVDDMLTGAHNIDDLLDLKHSIAELLKKAGLYLSKWNSNHPRLRAEDTPNLELYVDQQFTKTLGTIWNVIDDKFYFKLPVLNIKSFTKRSVLSTAARIFDVLGVLSPVVIRLKIMLQELWISKVGWDEPFSEHFCKLWLDISSDLQNINSLTIPRYVFTENNSKVEIHGFADASQRAYGCAIYVRAKVAHGIKVSLLIAKSKVAPVKAQSLPRLELCSALLLSSTWEKIHCKITCYVDRVVFWSDSQIVLHWLKLPSSSLNCFVANRVSQIQTQSIGITWRHVPSKSNPADIVSRGCSASEISSTMWFTGPDFLYHDETEWPTTKTEDSVCIDDCNLEKRKLVSFKCTSDNRKNCIISEILNNSSSFMKALRIISLTYRAINGVPPNRALKTTDVSFSSDEIDTVFWKTIAKIQQIEYAEEFESISKNIEVSKSLRCLSPFIHEMTFGREIYKILRVGGRLLKAPIQFDAKFPAILPKNNRFSYLYIQFLHQIHLHAGAKALIGLLRQKIWIINVRDLVRKVVNSCIHCFHYKPKLQHQIMGNLPADRLRAHRPFLVSGVDFCGPFYISYGLRGKRPYKTYLAVFICFASKAVHLEIVSNLSTNAFLMCLKRFTGRRGMPQRIFCDNATNFVGAKTDLKKLHETCFNNQSNADVLEYSNQCGFEFCFIPPRSPHFGGLWESAVKSAKTLIVKNVSQARLTLEEFGTLVIEVEAILNSRPICPLSNDPNDGEALTPGHLLIGSPILSVPDKPLECEKISNLSRYHRVSFLKQQFWDLWRRDYIHLLQQKSKWFSSSPNLKKDDIVLVHEDNLPPQLWLLGRVTSIFLGNDGRCRVVEIKTKRGVIKRPIHKVALLPIS